MDKSQLLKNVNALGYHMFETEKYIDFNVTIAEVVKSSDRRLLEGFPVMLANSLEKGLFDFGEVQNHLEKPQEKNLFHKLVMMSLAIYDYLKVELSFTDKINKSDFFNSQVFHVFLSQFKEEKDLDKQVV